MLRAGNRRRVLEWLDMQATCRKVTAEGMAKAMRLPVRATRNALIALRHRGYVSRRLYAKAQPHYFINNKGREALRDST